MDSAVTWDHFNVLEDVLAVPRTGLETDWARNKHPRPPWRRVSRTVYDIELARAII